MCCALREIRRFKFSSPKIANIFRELKKTSGHLLKPRTPRQTAWSLSQSSCVSGVWILRRAHLCIVNSTISDHHLSSLFCQSLPKYCPSTLNTRSHRAFLTRPNWTDHQQKLSKSTFTRLCPHLCKLRLHRLTLSTRAKRTYKTRSRHLSMKTIAWRWEYNTWRDKNYWTNPGLTWWSTNLTALLWSNQ